MASFPSEDERLKELFKTALLEVLEERKDLLRDLVEESLEDIALARAIDAGQRTGEVDRGEVISLVEGGPLIVRFDASFASDVRALKDKSLLRANGSMTQWLNDSILCLTRCISARWDIAAPCRRPWR